MITGFVVLKIVLMPSRQRRASLANSGPLWSMTGVSIARKMRSGIGVGPGMCRAWRPGIRAEFCAIGEKFLESQWVLESVLWLVALNTGCHSPSSQFRNYVYHPI